MKHIKEFEDKEIEDLAGDLEKIGHEGLKGWYFSSVSGEEGYFSARAIIAHNENEVEKILREYWKWREKILMPERVKDGYTYLGTTRIFDSFLECILSLMMYKGEINFYQMYKDLKVRAASSKVPMLIEFPAYNPILATNKLEELFTNSREVMSKDLDDFEEESTEYKFPDFK